MKIAMIGQKGIPATFGGVERHVEEISCRLTSNEYKVFVYARSYYTPQQKKQYKGVNIIHLPTIRTKHLDAISHTLLSTMHAIFKLHPDVIHYHGMGPALCLWIPKLLSPKTKVVFTFHSQDYYHQKWNGLAQWSLRFGEKIGCVLADEVIAVSRYLQTYIKEKYHRPAVYAPHGTNHEKYMPAKIIKKWGLKKDNYVLVVSRLIPHKGIHYLIQAFQNIATDKKLVIVGSAFYAQGYEKSLKNICQDNNQCLFLGNQKGKALKELYSNAYLFIHPSEQEGLPLVVLEAASFGQAILLSDIPQHQSIFDHLPFYFKNKNIKDLRKQLKLAIKKSSLVKRKGQKIKKYSLEHYDWDKSLKKIMVSYS